MDNICATCAAYEQCKYRNHWEDCEDGCDEMIAKMIEDARNEYRAAWYAYINEED